MNKSYIASCKINNVKEYLEIINKIHMRWNINDYESDMTMWYRGQNCDKPLIPSVFREKRQANGYDWHIHEAQLYNDFNALYRNYANIEFHPNELCEKYSFMQHNGIPTRLLDWTNNALYALFFSLYKPMSNETSVVWILNVSNLNSFAINDDVPGPFTHNYDIVKLRLLLPEYFINEDINFVDKKINKFLENEYVLYKRKKMDKLPVAFYPSTKENIRIISQGGSFTIHGVCKKGIDEIIEEERKDNILFKIEIVSDHKGEIYQELKNYGINIKTVFPDLEGLAKYLVERWTY